MARLLGGVAPGTPCWALRAEPRAPWRLGGRRWMGRGAAIPPRHLPSTAFYEAARVASTRILHSILLCPSDRSIPRRGPKEIGSGQPIQPTGRLDFLPGPA